MDTETVVFSPEEAETGWNWYSWWVILLIHNAVVGLIAFEWAWLTTQRHRTLRELDDFFPAFRRTDIHKWRKWRFYFGAMTIMLPRLICGISTGILIII